METNALPLPTIGPVANCSGHSSSQVFAKKNDALHPCRGGVSPLSIRGLS
jgi:hypothetical protein